MDRQMDGQAKNNRAPPTRLRGPKYILGHTDVLINEKHVFCKCQYLYILRQKKTLTLTFIKTLCYRFHWSRTTLRSLPTPGRFFFQKIEFFSFFDIL